MRTVTITRHKSFVGSLAAFKVYVEDPERGDLEIRGVKCRKVCSLKNGKTESFAIGSGETKLYVIGDALSKDYCNEYYVIPAGEEDVSLSGKCHYNPSIGNPFRFEGLVPQEVLDNRKKNAGKGKWVIIISVLVGLVVGTIVGVMSALPGNDPKEFSAEGMRITLTEAFSQVDMEGYAVCYGSRDVAVLSLKESFSLVEGFEKYTLEEYAELVLANTADDSITLKKADGLLYMDYYFANPQNNRTYYYLAVPYKTSDAFWLITFSTEQENVQQYYDQFFQWARSVTFA